MVAEAPSKKGHVTFFCVRVGVIQKIHRFFLCKSTKTKMSDVFACIIIGSIIGCIFLAILAIYCCNKLHNNSNGNQPFLKQIHLLVPPVFYTDCEKDPLYQDDMLEKPAVLLP